MSDLFDAKEYVFIQKMYETSRDFTSLMGYSVLQNFFSKNYCRLLQDYLVSCGNEESLFALMKMVHAIADSPLLTMESITAFEKIVVDIVQEISVSPHHVLACFYVGAKFGSEDIIQLVIVSIFSIRKF
jgi:hypothetical protein